MSKKLVNEHLSAALSKESELLALHLGGSQRLITTSPAVILAHNSTTTWLTWPVVRPTGMVGRLAALVRFHDVHHACDVDLTPTCVW